MSNIKEEKNGPSLILLYSFSSGILASVVSILIKLAFDTSLSPYWLQKGALIALAFVSNSLMWLLFSRSLALSDNTVYATGLNKLANFVVSALVGLVLFNEHFDLIQWSIGIVFISLGLFLIASASAKNQQHEKSKVS